VDLVTERRSSEGRDSRASVRDRVLSGVLSCMFSLYYQIWDYTPRVPESYPRVGNTFIAISEFVRVTRHSESLANLDFRAAAC
jgi:hypothetical protein